MVGRASVAITEQIRQASDIADVVGSFVNLRRAGRQFKALCPFHREKTPSFLVNPERQIFKCFGCGVGGDVFKFIQLRESVGFLDARSILAARAGISIEDDPPSEGPNAGPGRVEIERANRWARRWFRREFSGPDARFAMDYALGRGIDRASLDRFDVGYAPPNRDALIDSARRAGLSDDLLLAAGLAKRSQDGGLYGAFRNRLMFPIQDAMKRTIGFGGRTLGDDPAKYVNSPQTPLFDKSRCLYGLHVATDAFREQRVAVVVEGYTDCIMAHQHGFSHTVATLGTALTIEHVRILRRYVDAVILVFDPDTAGQNAADQALHLFLGEQLDVRVAIVPEQQDPAQYLLEAGSERFQHVLTSATDALEFKWRQIQRQYRSAATGPGRRRAIEEFLALVVRSADFGAYDPIQRGLIRNQVGKLLGLPSDEVERQLRIVARRTGRAAGESRRPPQEMPQRPKDAVSAAMRDLLQVLLNEPSYYDSIATEFNPDLIADPETREIARAVEVMARENPDFKLTELISCFDSVQTSGQILELQLSGEKRGNFAATVEGAVRCLQDAGERRRIDGMEADLRGRHDAGTAADDGVAVQEPDAEAIDDRSKVRAMSQGARQMRHFAARRHLATSSARQAESGEPRPQP